MKKRIVKVLTTTMVMGSLAGAAIPVQAESEDFNYTVGICNVADSDENCYLACKTFKDVVESQEFADAVGHEVKVEWTESNLDVNKQMSNVETLIAKDVDAVLMIGCDNDSSASAVQACNDAGIPMFMVVSEATNGDYRFIGFNEYDCGYHQGKYIVDNAEEGAKICLLEGVEGRSATIERGEGIHDAIAERRFGNYRISVR